MRARSLGGLMMLGFLGGCAGLPDEAPAADQAAVASRVDPSSPDLDPANGVVCLKTDVGSLLVRQKEADTLERLLAGELVGKRYMAVALAGE